MLRFRNGALGVVEMSRHSAWGYDIRTEVAGALGKVVVEAPHKTQLTFSRRFGYEGDHYENFPDRFEVAYRLELEAFFRTLAEGGTPAPGPGGGARDAPARPGGEAQLARGPTGPGRRDRLMTEAVVRPGDARGQRAGDGDPGRDAAGLRGGHRAAQPRPAAASTDRRMTPGGGVGGRVSARWVGGAARSRRRARRPDPDRLPDLGPVRVVGGAHARPASASRRSASRACSPTTT